MLEAQLRIEGAELALPDLDQHREQTLHAERRVRIAALAHEPDRRALALFDELDAGQIVNHPLEAVGTIDHRAQGRAVAQQILVGAQRADVDLLGEHDRDQRVAGHLHDRVPQRELGAARDARVRIGDVRGRQAREREHARGWLPDPLERSDQRLNLDRRDAGRDLGHALHAGNHSAASYGLATDPRTVDAAVNAAPASALHAPLTHFTEPRRLP